MNPSDSNWINTDAILKSVLNWILRISTQKWFWIIYKRTNYVTWLFMKWIRLLNEYIQATDTHKPVSIQYVPFIFSAVESLYVQNSKNIQLQLNDHATIQSSKPFNIHGVRVLKFTEIFFGWKINNCFSDNSSWFLFSSSWYVFAQWNNFEVVCFSLHFFFSFHSQLVC